MWEKPDELVKSSTGNNRWRPSVKSYVEQSHAPTKFMSAAAEGLLTTPYPDQGLTDLTDASKALTVSWPFRGSSRRGGVEGGFERLMGRSDVVRQWGNEPSMYSICGNANMKAPGWFGRIVGSLHPLSLDAPSPPLSSLLSLSLGRGTATACSRPTWPCTAPPPSLT